jgi:hypothetical protein
VTGQPLVRESARASRAAAHAASWGRSPDPFVTARWVRRLGTCLLAAKRPQWAQPVDGEVLWPGTAGRSRRSLRSGAAVRKPGRERDQQPSTSHAGWRAGTVPPVPHAKRDTPSLALPFAGDVDLLQGTRLHPCDGVGRPTRREGHPCHSGDPTDHHKLAPARQPSSSDTSQRDLRIFRPSQPRLRIGPKTFGPARACPAGSW